MELSDKEIKDRVEEHLFNRKRPKVWMTATGLIKRLGIDIHQHSMYRLLEEMTKEDIIRNSRLPSAKSLEVLWGHRSLVKDLEAESVTLTDVDDEYFDKFSDFRNSDFPICFISHSHKDVKKVMELSHTLLEKNIYPWVAECEINEGGQINDSVIKGLKQSDMFMVFFSRHALKSVWTRKEFDQHEQYINSKDRNPIVVFDDSDLGLIELFAKYETGNYRDSAIVNSDFWNYRCDNFMHDFIDFGIEKSTQIYGLGEQRPGEETFKSIKDFDVL